MGNLNFQDDPNENPEKDQNQDQNQNQDQSQEQPDLSDLNDPRADEGFIDDPTSGSSKLLWIAIIVVVVAGIGGALYLFHRSGYLKFPGKKQSPVTTMTAPAPVAKAPVEAKRATPVAKPTPKGSGNFALQVSAFRTRRQAGRYVSMLNKQGIQARIVETDIGTAKWFRVCTGSFNTKLKAIAAIQGMKKKVGTDVWVVPAQ